MADHIYSDLLFAYLALRQKLVEPIKLASVCCGWSMTPHHRLSDLLVDTQLLSPSVAQSLQRRIEQNLAHYNNDASRAFADLFLQGFRTENHPDIVAVFHEALCKRVLKDSAGGNGTEEDGSTDSRSTASIRSTENSKSYLGRFELRSVLGEGGVGRVWLAHDPKIGREVAVKELLDSRANQQSVNDRFMREMCITGRLEHPNIVPVYDASGSVTSRPHYVMQLIKGQTLGALIAEYHEHRKSGSVPPLLVYSLQSGFQQACHAISYAHSRGILHRDLKPDNIIVGEFGRVSVADWGLAKQRGESDERSSESDSGSKSAMEAAQSDLHCTVAGTVLGTPAFFAPEQAAGNVEAIDERTDIYGLGAILFMMTTGREPHRPKPGESRGAFLARIAAGPSPRIRDIDRAAAPELDAICAKAMAHRPEERYSTPCKLFEDYRSYLVGEEVLAYRTPWYRRSIHWLRRRRSVTSVVVLSALILIGACSVGAYRSYQSLMLITQLEESQLMVQTRDTADHVRRGLQSLPDQLFLVSQVEPAHAILDAEQDTPPGEPIAGMEAIADRFAKILEYMTNVSAVFLTAANRPTHELLRLERVDFGTERIVDVTGRYPIDPSLAECLANAARLAAGEELIRNLRLTPHPNMPHSSYLVGLAPLFHPENRKFGGVLVVAMNYRGYFQNLTSSPYSSRSFLVDSDGNILFDSDARGATVGEPVRVQDVYADLGAYFENGNRDRSFRVERTGDGTAMLFGERLHLDYGNSSHDLVVISHCPLDDFDSRLRERTFSLAWTALFQAALAIGLAGLGLYVFTKVIEVKKT